MIEFTDRQRQAVETVGGSVTVTAAAGSGKTAVLAERCAYLVCDLPPPRRCGVDELLVVTFTEAAAAEMKARILQAVRQRLQASPRDAYLRTQAALIDTARISTLHSFCLWMLRRWFSEASIDPAAAVLQEEEARLLRQETIEGLFGELYESETELGRGFVRLVDEYGLGNDGTIAEDLLKLDAFLRSLPDPQGWLADARAAVGSKAGETVAAFAEIVRAEIRRQQPYVEGAAALIERQYPVGALYGQKLCEYAEVLGRWSAMSDLDALGHQINEYKLISGSGVRVSKDAPDKQRAERDAARALFTDVQKRLFKQRLQRLARFNTEQMQEGLAAVAPHVETLCGLATEFGRRYQQAKNALDALDFADLERGAYRLLIDQADSENPSPIAGELHDRYPHVLVDEFQDINPLQAAILRLVSREDDAGQANNLFCVGDVKQSIYRFRLAEPELFRSRIEQAQACGTGESACVRLQDNFRSSPHLIDGINLLFERLMTRGVGGVDYDESARLRPGLKPEPDAQPHSTELHLLERRVAALDDDDGPGDERYVDPADPAHWETVEREAYLIAWWSCGLRA